MKLRIKGNSLRMRLTKTEVGRLADTGYLEEETLFSGNRLIYAVQRVDNGNELSATLDTNKITMFVPDELIKDWPQNNIVGFNSTITLSENDTLYLLLEKDFVCVNETTEDQNDHYQNPDKTC
jgi:hypothetical protein